MRRARRPIPARTIQSVHVPAPIGGINTTDGASAMPPTDAPYLYNLISAEYGLRSRLGYKEWCTGLGGEVRTILPFSASLPSNDKLFSTTSAGIWDVTASSASPSQVLSFADVTGLAGFGISTAMSTPGGRFLLYCDEVNGYHVFTEAGAWAAVAAGVAESWAELTVYLAGDKVTNGGKVYTCTAGGTSGALGGPTGAGTGITDGSVTWNYVSASSANVIGPSLADQHAGLALDPTALAFVTVWKGKVWLVEKNSTRAWYLPTNSIYGVATSFDFGAKMRAGGPLVGLFNWSYDGGSGLDTLLVGISSAGDVVIYQGTDPTSANTFASTGCWFLGGLPKGRRIATDYGGDVLVASLLGVMPLSKLVTGATANGSSVYETWKVSNIFNEIASVRQSLDGWALHVHPTDNALLVLVPTASGAPTEQMAMSFATKGWSRFRGLPMLSAAVWGGVLYFGTVDGRVCQNTGYVDAVLLSDPNSFSQVQFSGLTAYRDGGSQQNKRVQMIRPTVMSQAPNPLLQCTAKFDFDVSEPSPPSGVAAAGGGNTWDSAVWDSSQWGGDYSATQPLSGAAGMGRNVAVAFRGSAIARTVMVGFDILFDVGGLL